MVTVWLIIETSTLCIPNLGRRTSLICSVQDGQWMLDMNSVVVYVGVESCDVAVTVSRSFVGLMTGLCIV